MDKLKALKYFMAAAEEGSFSGAARRLDVSVPAIVKMVNALELELDAKLLDRSTQGLTLTSRGEAYRETCVPLLAKLSDADRAVGGSDAQPLRILTVGAPALLTYALLVPALPRFHELHPRVHVSLRTVDNLTITDTQTRGLDALIALGWPGNVRLVQRPLAQSRLIVCASPDYWRRHARPVRPADLTGHACPLVRSPEGTVLDLWRHSRDGQTEEVAVRGWLTCESRVEVLQAVLCGQGVGRFADLSVWHFVRDGHLQPVLGDWVSKDSPPFSALFGQEARRDAAVQGFISFVAELLAQCEAECRVAIGERPTVVLPEWYARRQGRASTGAR